MSLPKLARHHFLRCDSALAATLLVRGDVRPSLSILDAFDATALLVTRFCALFLDMASFSLPTHVPYGEGPAATAPFLPAATRREEHHGRSTPRGP